MSEPQTHIDPRETVTCATCEMPVQGPVTRHDGEAFCCAGCAAGGPCVCSYDGADRPTVRTCLDIEGALGSPFTAPRRRPARRRQHPVAA